MLPDDPRHGKTAGYWAGCRERCCKDAIAAGVRHYRTRLYIQGPQSVDATGTVRRIHALMALGWRGDDIDEAIGRGGRYTVNLLTRAHTTVHRATAQLYADAYDRLSMKLGPSVKTRQRAQAAGWAPPLAWDEDEIDDPDARPRGQTKGRQRDVLDEAVVERLLACERVPRSTPAEKAEALRRWVARGGSEADFCRLNGLKDGRYRTGGAA